MDLVLDNDYELKDNYTQNGQKRGFPSGVQLGTRRNLIRMDSYGKINIGYEKQK